MALRGFSRTPGLYGTAGSHLGSLLQMNVIAFFAPPSGERLKLENSASTKMRATRQRHFELLLGLMQQAIDYWNEHPIQPEIDVFTSMWRPISFVKRYSPEQNCQRVVKRIFEKYIELESGIDDSYIDSGTAKMLIGQSDERVRELRKPVADYGNSLSDKLISRTVEIHPPGTCATWEEHYKARTNSSLHEFKYPFDVFKSKGGTRTQEEKWRDHLIDQAMFFEFDLQNITRVLNLAKRYEHSDGSVRYFSLRGYLRKKGRAINSIYSCYGDLGFSTFDFSERSRGFSDPFDFSNY